MPTDPKAIPAPTFGPPAEAPKPSLWCTDCRTPLRAHYYALDERPVCAKCRTVYTAKITRGTGPQALWRAAAYGLGAALAGAAFIGIIIHTVGFGRIICAIAIGWMVATAINYATGAYFARRYRILAVVLTYFAVGLGSLTPVVVALATLPDEVIVADVSTAEADAMADDEALSDDEEYEQYVSVEEQALAELEAAKAAKAAFDATTPEQRAASDIAEASFVRAAGSLVVMLLTLPLLSLFTFGIHGAVVGLLALGYGIWKAWELTGTGVAYTVAGPYRVGSGPIPPSL